jgi:hypothetical protein
MGFCSTQVEILFISSLARNGFGGFASFLLTVEGVLRYILCPRCHVIGMVNKS